MVDAAILALQAEIALLGAPPPHLDDVGEGGVRAECTLCPAYVLFDRGEYQWHATDYEIGALEAYVQHVHDEHRDAVGVS